MIERRYAAIGEAKGRTIAGVAVQYGDVARVPVYGRERIEAGAFGDVGGLDVILNRQHDRKALLARTGAGLVLEDSAEALTVRADLPHTREADDTLELVRRGVLRGLSVEMLVTGDRFDAGTRIVEAAKLEGIGIVDRPAFPASGVVARAKGNPRRARLRGRVAFDKKLSCRCRGAQTTHVQIDRNAFRTALKEAKAGKREIHAFTTGQYDSPVANISSGTLELEATGEALEVAITGLPETQAVADFLEAFELGLIVIRPYFPDPADGTVAEQSGTLRKYTAADLRAIELAIVSGVVEGLEPVALDFLRKRRTAHRRRWTWL